MKFNYYALKIVAICVAVFLLQITFKNFTEMFLLNEYSFVQPYRFLTSIFLHGDISHLLYNMFALALFGSILEKIIGGKRFLLIYFFSGVLANLIAINFYQSSLGASGAIYGILGSLVIISPLMVVFAFGIPMPMFIAGIFWAAGDLIGLFLPSNVGHIAHLSGMIVGILAGFYIRKSQKNMSKMYSGVKIDEREIRKWEDNYLK